ncbi:Spermatogenesis-associated protein 31A3 [Manis javanica]|nr:Spermatogenesis-associated protein 31A3 [Manis javanica]
MAYPLSALMLSRKQLFLPKTLKTSNSLFISAFGLAQVHLSSIITEFIFSSIFLTTPGRATALLVLPRTDVSPSLSLSCFLCKRLQPGFGPQLLVTAARVQATDGLRCVVSGGPFGFQAHLLSQQRQFFRPIDEILTLYTLLSFHFLLNVCRGRLREQEVASSLISHVECHQSRTPDRSDDHRSHQDTTGENKPQSLIRTEIRHPERPTLQKQLERQRALSSGVKRPQEVCSVPTSTRPEDSRVAAMLPENLPISPEMRKVLEQHLQEQFIHPPWELPGKIWETLEQVRLQGLQAGRRARDADSSRTVHYRRLDCQTHARLGKDVSALRNLLFQQIAFQDKPDAMP